MSENQSPQNSSNSQPISPLGSSHLGNTHLGNLEGVSQLLSNADSPPPSNGELMDLWEAVEVPEVPEVPEAVAAQAVAVNPENPGAPLEATQKATQKAARERELLALIHDLNECNDALLSRVAQLENNLESTQSQLKAKIANAQAAQDKMSQQVLSEQAGAQQVSQNAQQQVAKLVGKLETTEQALSRQQLINENLQTELTNSQERITQLERECALTSQQHAEEAQARLKAETISRDLRSRLQRQQRYTLQFKAALEKSLTVNTRAAQGLTNGLTNGMTNGLSAEAARPIPFQNMDTDSVAMPKAQRITPWASADVTAAFQGIDPHLETLIRGIHQPSEPSIERSQPPISAATETRLPVAASPEAEAKLWQDLERVMGAPEVAAEVAAEVTATEVTAAEVTAAEVTAAVVTTADVLETSQPLDGGSPTPVNEAATANSADTADASKDARANVMAKSSKGIAQAKQEALALAESFAAAATRQSDPKVIFTEPSPWGSPLPERTPERTPERMPETIPGRAIAAQAAAQAATKIAAAQAAVQASIQAAAYAAPSPDTSAVSPLVNNPLRSQKKIGSLASVELPTFPNAKVGSFKR